MRAARSLGGACAKARLEGVAPAIIAIQAAASAAPRRNVQLIRLYSTAPLRSSAVGTTNVSSPVWFRRFEPLRFERGNPHLSHCIRVDAGSEIHCNLVFPAVAFRVAKSGRALSVRTDIVNDGVLHVGTDPGRYLIHSE